MSQSNSDRFTDQRPLFDDRYGQVGLASTRDGGAPVVVSTLRLPAPAPDDHIAALRADAESVSGLPGVAEFVEARSTDTGAWVAWDHEGFEPLRQILRTAGSLPQDAALDIAHQLAQIIGAAGERGAQHLDVSPDSVWVAAHERGYAVRLYRYGLRHLVPPYKTGFRGDVFWGTPEYMSPELCSSKGADLRSDLYSVGIVLLQMLTSKPPFASANPRTTMKRQIYEKPLPLRLAKPGLTGVQDLDSLLSHLLAKSPVKRTPHAEALISELESFRGTHLADFEWTPVGAASAAAAVDAAPAPAAAAPSEAELAAVPRAEAENVTDGRRGTLVFSGLQIEQRLDAGDSSPITVPKKEEPAPAPAPAPVAAAPTPAPAPAAAAAPVAAAPTPAEDAPTEMMQAAARPAPAPEPETLETVDPVPGVNESEPELTSVGRETSEDLSAWFADPNDPLQVPEGFEFQVKRERSTLLYVIGGVIILLVIGGFFAFGGGGETDDAKTKKSTPTAVASSSSDEAKKKAEAEAAAKAKADAEAKAKAEAAAKAKAEAEATAKAEAEAAAASAEGTQVAGGAGEPAAGGDEAATAGAAGAVGTTGGAEPEAGTEPAAGGGEPDDGAAGDDAAAAEAPAEDEVAPEDEVQARIQAEKVRALETAGDESMSARKYFEAVAYFEAASKLDPENPTLGAKLLKAQSELQRQQKPLRRRAAARTRKKKRRRTTKPARTTRTSSSPAAKTPAPKPKRRATPPPPTALPPADRTASVKSELRKGMDAYKSAHYAEALKAFEKAQKLDPGNMTVRLWIKRVRKKMTP